MTDFYKANVTVSSTKIQGTADEIAVNVWITHP
jgi:hypothetical protein